MRLALAMWCFTSPPPKMIIPVFLAKMAWVLMSRRSALGQPSGDPKGFFFYFGGGSGSYTAPPRGTNSPSTMSSTSPGRL